MISAAERKALVKKSNRMQSSEQRPSLDKRDLSQSALQCVSW